ncbi:CASC3/Barentsz eIF4AIII binding-domain-containing protein [Triangularia verruculosa]|uniref:CASC3/Barentsz eIF4AIII binding-domain-containing protein n=1 Tax=Triangularia verruculosa TaxID=2587418 RepID=A0AAN7AU87_9PEZI|nr:CASC3/Barentsz eIF4AIII binding-domain-containing protein [Triangularia verruculosa]
MAAVVTRRKKTIGQRRRVEDDGDDEAGPGPDLDEDSLTDPSSDEHDPADDSDTSNVDEVSPRLLNARKALGNGSANRGYRRQNDIDKDSATKKPEPVIAGADVMLEGLTLADKESRTEELEFDEVKTDTKAATAPSVKDSAPVIVSSTSIPGQPPRGSVQDQKRREHEEYRKKRDEDPTFVPNRGNFFLHDHRHAGPAANGFRPFARTALRPGRGGRAGGFGGQFIPMNSFQNASDPTTRGPWQHDMHEQVAETAPPAAYRPSRYRPDPEGPANGNGVIPHAPAPKSPINRNMSSEKVLGTVTVRVYLPSIAKEPKLFPGLVLKAYTKLPDHRPPLRRDKPVRISLPYHAPPLMPRYIYPSSDRSFIFIPRALRPNQQRSSRGRGPRSVMGSGPFSRRTSVWGGSVYGSMYSPSVAMSRRSSIAHDMGRDFMLSPTGSAISRPPLAVDANKPVVRLPPFAQPPAPVMQAPAPVAQPDSVERLGLVAESSINDLPQPQTHPLPQRPAFQENKPTSIPMHQPRPQKAVSIDNIESPVRQNANAPPPYQQAFLHQVPLQIPNGFPPDAHARHPSYQSQLSATPLSQIPERAIHAAPFQPTAFGQPGYYAQPYPAMQPQQGYYYPQGFPPPNMGPNASAPAFVPAGSQGPPPINYATSAQGDGPPQVPGQPPSQNLVTQEVNGTVYYFNANEIPSVAGYPPFPLTQPYPPGMVPAPDGYYYQQPTPGMVYYPQ